MEQVQLSATINCIFTTIIVACDLFISMHSKHFRQFSKPIDKYNPKWAPSSHQQFHETSQNAGPVIHIGQRRPQYQQLNKRVVRFPGTDNITNSICFAVCVEKL